MLQYFLVPVFTLVITLPVTLFFFGPIGNWIGEAISFVCTTLANTLGNWSVVAFYAAIQPFLIMLGAGNFIMPVIMAFLAEMGYDPLFLAACTISDIAVGGAMFGYFLRAKDVKQKELFGTVSFSAILGCTEPAVFGVFVKYRRPFVAVMIGGGLGGLFAGLMNVKTYTMAWGLAGLPSYIGVNDFNNFYYMIAAVAIGFVAATVAGFFLCQTEQKDGAEKIAAEPEAEIAVNGKKLEKETIGAAAEGQIIALEEIADKAFSSGAMGKGLGIKPSANQVYAPVDGEVTCVFPTKHAIGIQSEQGAEILLHIGIDTVQLEGRHFDVKVEQGQKIHRGDLLAEVDFEGVRKEGFDDTIIMIVTNTSEFLDVIPVGAKAVTKDSECLNVVMK